MRINYTLPGSQLTGGIRTFYEISKRLVKKGHEVSFTLPKQADKSFDWPGGLFYPHSSLKRVAIGRVIEVFIGRDLEMDYQYAALERATPECDANFATFCYTTFPVHRSGKGRPFYHMQHFEPLLFSDVRLQKIAEESYYLPLAKISNSSWLKRIVKERTGADSELILHGLNHENFYPRETCVEGNRKRVVAYGAERVWKGVPDLLEAMEIVLSQRNDIELILWGSGSVSHTRLGVPYVFQRGLTDGQLAELCSSADVIVCPSWYESFPLPPLEGMACGTPVITTSIGTEDYAIDGDTAMVVPPRDPRKMAGAILEILGNEDLRERLKKAGPKKAKEFTWDRTADAVDAFIRREQT